MASRDQQLQIRVSRAQKAAIRAAAERAGVGMSEWLLSRALPEPDARLMALVRRAEESEAHAAWAEIIELLQKLRSVDFQATVGRLEPSGLSRFTSNYLAALVEMTAARLGLPAPAWTRAVEPLPTPWFGTRLRRLREHLLVHAPVPFRRRNIFVDAGVGDRV